MRLRIFAKTSVLDQFAHLFMEKLKAAPTAKRKEGKTKSVGVKPCHAACWSGRNTYDQLPGEFTMIIKTIAMPRKTSSAPYRLRFVSMAIALNPRKLVL